MTPEPVELEFVRRMDFPLSVVFDALVDQDLVGGWLAHAAIEPRTGGSYDLVWLTSSSFPPTRGTITLYDEPLALGIETDNRGGFQFLLESQGASRATTGTELTTRITVSVDHAFLPRVAADWQSNLDQLEELLRGRPVDWAHWDRDRAPAWSEYLNAAGGR